MTTVALMTDSAQRLLAQMILEAFPLGERRTVAPRTPDGNEWPTIAETAIRSGLAPLLYASFKKMDSSIQVPLHTLDQLRDAHFRSNVSNMFMYWELARLLDSFAAENIPVILLKGPALALQLYPDPGLRPFTDLDLLVHESQAEKSLALLARRGYSPLPEMIPGFERRFSGQQAYTRIGRSPSQVDLHWHLFVIAYYRKHIPIDWFWQRTAPIEIGGRKALALTPEAQLIHLCSHYKLHHHREGLIWLYDIALLVARHSKNMNWGEWLRAVRDFGLSLPVQSAFAETENRWGVSPPPDAKRSIEALAPGPYERFLFALTSRGEMQARVILDGIDLGRPTASLHLWLRHMFPTPDFMRTRYHISNGGLLPLYYLWRILDGGFKAARALVAGLKQDRTGQVTRPEK